MSMASRSGPALPHGRRRRTRARYSPRLPRSRKRSGSGAHLPALPLRERTPHNDPRRAGVFFASTHGADRRALVVLRHRRGLVRPGGWVDALASAGTRAGTLSLVGGGSRSALWGTQLFADVLRTRLQVHAGSGPGGLGSGAPRPPRLGRGRADRVRPGRGGERAFPVARRGGALSRAPERSAPCTGWLSPSGEVSS